MLDAAIDGAEGSQQPAPGVVTALQYLFAVAVGHFLQLGAQGTDGVILVINRVAEQEQPALLRRQQEDEAHHDRQSRFIQLLFVHARQQLAATVLVGAVHGLNQNFDRVAHLIA